MTHTLRIILTLILLFTSLVAVLPAPAAAPRSTTPDITALAAIVFADTKSPPAQFGVYLGHGLVLTNWHPWTLDGRFYTDESMPLSPSQQALHYDDDGTVDPGERILNMADCDGTWTPLTEAGATCTPYLRLETAGFIFPAAGDTVHSEPVPISRLLFASRAYDIALFAVDPAAVEARGVSPARLSLAPTGADHAVTVAYQFSGQPAAAYAAILPTAEPVLLPVSARRVITGPWRVSSLSLDTPEALIHGGPVFDTASGDLVGLTWRAAPEEGTLWVTPAALWGHALFAANDSVQDENLAAVLDAATTAPIDAPPTLGDPLAPDLGNAGIDVLHYALDLAVDVSGHSLSGSATLAIRATYDQLASFSLDATNLGVTRVQVGGQDVSFAAKDHKLQIILPEPVPYGTLFQVVISYQTTPQPIQSLYMPFFELGMLFVDGQAYTLNEPDAAHTWFPCNDHPSDRATYRFAVRVTDPLEAVANGQLTGTDENDDGTRTFHWQMSSPMATYLALVAVADFATVESTSPDGVPIHNFVYPDAVEAGAATFGYTGEAMVVFEDLFGPYPFGSYGHVVVDLSGRAMESQTMSIMPDSTLEVSEESAFIIMVHELAHQWFGNTVTPALWSDIWLNEGFATHAEWLSQERRYGMGSAIAARSASEQSLLTDNRQTPLIDPDPAEMFGLSSYDKGAWVLHMLREEMGDEAFLKLLKTYIATFRDRPATSVDFWRLAEEVSGRDLGWFFSQWLLQGGLPRYTLYWTTTETGADVLLCPALSDHYRLRLPLRFGTESNSATVPLDIDGSHPVQASFDLGFAPSEALADPDQAVLAQVQVQPIAALPEACPAQES